MKTTMSLSKNKDTLQPLIHIIGWAIFFSFPLFFGDKEGKIFTVQENLKHYVVPITFLILFYINYIWLVNKLLFSNKKQQFILVNALLVILFGIGLHLWFEYLSTTFIGKGARPPFPKGSDFYFMITHILRNIFSLTLTVALSAAIKMTFRWNKAEKERQELEKSKSEAELKSLKNQLNPHFLLNTLNNIYALIAFSPEKAQQAVHDLSKLLRYVLYENNQPFVPLVKEIDFIKNYIELMRIRLSDSVKLETNMLVSDQSETVVAPMLFITLIENAFKHGVSYSHPSYIHITISEKPGEEIVCKIENSYFPKSDQDKSGSGIGLEHLRKRLGLIYPGHYKWDVDMNKESYSSCLTIYLNKPKK